MVGGAPVPGLSLPTQCAGDRQWSQAEQDALRTGHVNDHEGLQRRSSPEYEDGWSLRRCTAGGWAAPRIMCKARSFMFARAL